MYITLRLVYIVRIFTRRVVVVGRETTLRPGDVVRNFIFFFFSTCRFHK